MKKTVSIILFLALMLTLCACGSSTTGNTSASSSPASGSQANSSPVSNETNSITKVTDVSEIQWDSTPPESYNMSDIYPDATPIKYASKTSSATFYAQRRGMDVADWFIIQQIPIRTEGRYRVDYYPDGQLASSNDDHISGILTGAIDITSLNLGSWGDFTNAFAEFNVPYAFNSMDMAHSMLNGEIGEAMAANMEADVGVKFCYYNTLGFRNFTNNVREVTSVEDFAGLKLRVQTDALQIAAFEALGCAVGTLSYSELFSAIQQGVYEAEENPASGVYSDSFYEVQDYMTLTNHIYSGSVMVMNPQLWESLSDEDKAIFEEIFWEAQLVGEAATIENEEFFLTTLEEEGMLITELSDDVYNEIVEIMKADVWPECEKAMGTDRWNALMATIDNYNS